MIKKVFNWSFGAFCFSYNSYFYDKIYLYYNTYIVYDSKVYEL